MMLSGETRLVGVIGDPVRHSLSPVIHAAAFEALGLDWASVAFEVGEASLPEAVSGMRALGIEGLSVTMPHKATAAEAVDVLAPSAAALGVVNCIARDGDRLVGHSTDGVGFVNALRDGLRFDPAGRSCLILGAGGAARSIVAALAASGAADIRIVNRTESRAHDTAQLAGPVGRVGSAADIDEVDLVVNTTSIGMAGDASLPCDPELLREGQVLVDIIYNPFETPLLAAAHERSLMTQNGLPMLVHQAAEQIRIWTGSEPPIGAMIAATEHVLAQKASRQRAQS